MYTYAYYIKVDNCDSATEVGYAGLTCADSYGEAYKNISSVYEDPHNCITHLELDEFDALAPCIELPPYVVQNIIDNGGDYVEECADVEVCKGKGRLINGISSKDNSCEDFMK